MDYRWVAQDARGEIWWFQLEPAANVIHNGFYTDGGNNEFVKKGNPNPNWRDSLIDLETEDFAIVGGILIRKPKAEKELTDTELLDAIVGHELRVDVNGNQVDVMSVIGESVTNKKGNIRKAIKKWLKKNVDKKELTE